MVLRKWQIKNKKLIYSNNVLNGILTRWYRNSNYESRSNYKDGKLDGQALMFDENGNIISEENYSNDTLDGKYTQWFSSGKMKIKGNYKKGYFSGRWLYYNLTGEIIGTGNYTMGNGIQKAWYPNGKIMREINYQNNLKHGSEKWYTPDGQLDKVLFFDEGIIMD